MAAGNIRRVGTVRLTAALLSLLAVAAVPAAMEADGGAGWQVRQVVSGVAVQARPTMSGFDVHRAEVVVCANLHEITEFLADAAHFDDWIAFTEEVRLLEREELRIVYYLKSRAPWPFRPRDMIYEMINATGSASEEALHFEMTGLPDYLPPESDAVRLVSVSGDWWLTAVPGGTEVSLELYANPGRVPRYFANRRAARMLGETLANLSSHFTCPHGTAQ